MLCAHTVRRLKPGTFDQFSEAFMPTEEDAPPAGSASTCCAASPTRTRSSRSASSTGRSRSWRPARRRRTSRARRDSIDPFVDAVIANGVYEIVATLAPDDAVAR